MTQKEELNKLGLTFKDSSEEELSYEELLSKYKKLKNWLFWQGVEIPISIEPYTKSEYESRCQLPELYWTERDRQAIAEGVIFE